MESEAARVREALASAIGLHQRGRLKEAETAYMAVLEDDQNNADALHYLGVMRHQQGRSLLAVDLVQRALEIAPDYVDAYNNLGNIFNELGCPQEALEAYKKAIELKPDHPDASRNLPMVLRTLKRFEESIAAHQRAIELQPENLKLYYGLATTYKEMSQIDEALNTLRKALTIRADPEGFAALGRLLYALRRIDEAAATYAAWLRSDPESPVAKHMLAACTGKEIPSRAADEFVAQVFDSFAESFDKVLTRLDYRAPMLVGQALQRTAGEPRGDLDILDAGCGTGLLAPYLRPYAKRLVGIDLSPKMLQKAAKRGVYDDIVTAELVSFLESSSSAYDVVASSDTLVYFGDLRAAFAAARISLRRGGYLIFTLEHSSKEDEAADGYRIHAHGRYSHTESYVRKTLAEVGLEIIDIEKAHLRREGSGYVAGLVVLARCA